MSGTRDSSRPLPARPSLEFERKNARTLLRALQRGDAGALARAQAQRSGPGHAEAFKLADAQFTIAREYGFLSWPKLVRYYEGIERQRHTPIRAWYPLEHHEQQAEALLRAHQRGSRSVALSAATFIPRFYGKTVDEVLPETLTIDDVRLIVARSDLAPSWEALAERSRPDSPEREEGPTWDWFESPFVRAMDAIGRADFETLERIVSTNPQLLAVPPLAEKRPVSLLRESILREFDERSPEARRVSDWLVAHGADLRLTLNRLILFGFRKGLNALRTPIAVEFLTFLLDRGANAAYVAPNGITALEYVLLRYMNPDAGDFMARHAPPRTSFWIAAGLGDVRTMLTFMERPCRVTDAARRDRPDFLAAAGYAVPALPDADDTAIIWEALVVAAFNKRVAAIEALLDHGFPIDYRGWETPIVNIAVQNGDAALVEMLVRRGANLDLPGYMPAATARQLASSAYMDHAEPEAARRIQVACGVNPADVVRADARPVAPPRFGDHWATLMDCAREEAERLQQASVEPHNLLLALLRAKPSAWPLGLLHNAGVNVTAFRAAIAERLVPCARPSREIPLSAAAGTVVRRAAALAEAKRQGQVHAFHLGRAILELEEGPVADMLRAAGGDLDALRAAVRRTF